MTLLLSMKDVQSLLTMPEAIRVVEDAFRQHAEGATVLPQRTVVSPPEHNGVQLGMPAYIGGGIDALGLKVVTIYPDNPAKYGVATTIGVLLLNDATTGAPLALMDAGYLTAVRTGAVGGVAAKYLARKDATSVGLFGSGVQARAQLRALCAVRKVAAVMVYDPARERAADCAREMSEELGIHVESVADPRTAVQGMDIIVTASSSQVPVFDGHWLEPGQHINGIGSHSPDRRELDTVTIAQSKVVPDSTPACMVEAGDLIIPLKEGAIGPDHPYADLGDLVCGRKPGRENDVEVTLFKSVGLAIQDMSVGSLVYQRARERGVGLEFRF
ncbi:MAG: ornithine cyclodeaminase family protein [Candidatus Limnocylindrales bacterium]